MQQSWQSVNRKDKNMAPKRGGLGRGLDALIPSNAPGRQKTREIKKADAALSVKPEETAKKETTTAAAKKTPQSGTTASAEPKESKKAKSSTKTKTQAKPKAAEKKSQESKAEANAGTVSKDSVVMLRVAQIEPNRAQPRKRFDKEKLSELAASIREYGVVQPLLVQKADDHYEIIAGERRWRAAQEAGLKEVPAIVRDYSDREVVEISLIENLQREDLNPIEEADAYVRLMDEFQLTQEAVAKRVSKSRVAVTNSIRLLQLPQEIREMLIYGDIREGHARALLGITDAGKQIEAARLVARDGLSVRDAEKLARSVMKPAAPRRKTAVLPNDTVYKDLEEQLKSVLGTKVTINRRSKDKGRIEIEYYSVSELERILDLIRNRDEE